MFTDFYFHSRTRTSPSAQAGTCRGQEGLSVGTLPKTVLVMLCITVVCHVSVNILRKDSSEYIRVTTSEWFDEGILSDPKGARAGFVKGRVCLLQMQR